MGIFSAAMFSFIHIIYIYIYIYIYICTLFNSRLEKDMIKQLTFERKRTNACDIVMDVYSLFYI